MSIINDSAALCVSAKACKANYIEPTYDRYLFDLEKNYDYCQFVSWMKSNWKMFTYAIVVVYIVAIYLGHRRMKQRAPYRLQGALFAWNVALAIFSILSAWRTVPAFMYQLQRVGLHEMLCGPSFKLYNQATGLHIILFHISKVVELGDTAFIVARKAPLTFLHCFHHASVVFFVCSSSIHLSMLHGLVMTMNYFVHAFMYSYFTIKSLKIPVPKAVSISITLMQLLQMAIGLSATLYAYYMKYNSVVGCCVTEGALIISMSNYAIFFALFMNFFFKSYFGGKSKVDRYSKKRE